MKKQLFILLMCLLSAAMSGQQMTITDFELNLHDQTASNEDTKVIDDNGNPCALLKIETLQKGFTIDGGSVGIAKVEENHAGEIWVYVPANLRRITIAHNQLGILRDYVFPEALQPARTYIMKLRSGTVEQVVRQQSTSQYLVLTYEPADAMVEIDGDVVTGEAGSVRKKLSLGQHEYRISAKNYHPEVGIVTIAQEKVEKTVTLQPAFGWIEVKGPAGAVVYIDNTKVGEAPVKSQPLASGRHDIRVTRQLYLPYREQVVVNDNTVTNVEPNMVANFATVNLTVANDAEIWVNDERKGAGSVSVDLEYGEYTFETRKPNHRSQSVVRNINSSFGGTIELPAPVAIYGSLEVDISPIGAKVYLDGKLVGESPLILNEVLVGEHSVQVQKQGFKERSENVVVAEMMTSEIKGQLQENGSEHRQHVAGSDEAKHERPAAYQKHFEGTFDLNSNFMASHGGVGADIVLGSRLKPYCHLGAGLGIHSFMNAAIEDYNLLATLYFNTTLFIPTRGNVFPMFDLALGCDYGAIGINSTTMYSMIGLYAKTGFGFEAGMFRLSTGYEFLGNHTGYVKIGIKF